MHIIPNEIKAFITSLPNVVETAEDKNTIYEVGKKCFLSFDAKNSSILVKAPIKKLNILSAQNGVTLYEKEWLSIDLLKHSNKQLKEFILDSFHMVANKKALKKLYSQFPI